MQDFIGAVKYESQKQLENFCEGIFQKFSHNEAREIFNDSEILAEWCFLII